MILTNSNRVLYQLGKGVISRCLLPSLTGEMPKRAKTGVRNGGRFHQLWLATKEVGNWHSMFSGTSKL